MKYTPLRNLRLTVSIGLAFLFTVGMACLNAFFGHIEWAMVFSSFSGILLHMLLLQYQDYRRQQKWAKQQAEVWDKLNRNKLR